MQCGKIAAETVLRVLTTGSKLAGDARDSAPCISVFVHGVPLCFWRDKLPDLQALMQIIPSRALSAGSVYLYRVLLLLLFSGACSAG